jgi:hypothetical protein
VLIGNGGIAHFHARKTLLLLAKALFLLFRCPSLPGSVYIPTFFSDLLGLCFASLVQIVLGTGGRAHIVKFAYSAAQFKMDRMCIACSVRFAP